MITYPFPNHNDGFVTPCSLEALNIKSYRNSPNHHATNCIRTQENLRCDVKPKFLWKQGHKSMCETCNMVHAKLSVNWKYWLNHDVGIENWFSMWRPILAPYPDSKVHGANMGPTWVLSAPGRPHAGPINLAIRDIFLKSITTDAI